MEKTWAERLAELEAEGRVLYDNTARSTTKTEAHQQLDAELDSELERAFETLWIQLGGPELEKQFRWHPNRKWRADFVHVATKTLIEIQGGGWSQGRHHRFAGYADDCEKAIEAQRLGWHWIPVPDASLKFVELALAAIRGWQTVD